MVNDTSCPDANHQASTFILFIAGRGNLVTIFMSLALLGTIAVIVIVAIFFLRYLQYPNQISIANFDNHLHVYDIFIFQGNEQQEKFARPGFTQRITARTKTASLEVQVTPKPQQMRPSKIMMNMTTLVYHQILRTEDRVMPQYTSAILVRIHRPRGLTLHTITSADSLPRHMLQVSTITPVTNRTLLKLMTSFKQQTIMTIQTDAFKKQKTVMKYMTICRKTRTDIIGSVSLRQPEISYTLFYINFTVLHKKHFKIPLFQILNYGI